MRSTAVAQKAMEELNQAMIETEIKKETKDAIIENTIIKFNYPKINLVARTRNAREYRLIKAAGVNLLVDESEEIGKKLVEMGLTCQLK